MENQHVTKFLTASNCTPGFNIANVDKALAVCQTNARKLRLDSGCLFWATQARDCQVTFRNRELKNLEDYSLFREHFLCFRCAQWIPDVHYKKHLPLEELRRFCTAHISLRYQIPSCTEACSLTSTFSHPLDEETHWHLFHLQNADWPTFCKKCSCVIMKSVLPLHNLDTAFCEHAILATVVSRGVMTKTRHSFYPGHPRLHLFHLGAWPVLALLALKRQERIESCLVYINLLQLLELTNLQNFGCLDTTTILNILSFQCMNDKFRIKDSAFSLLHDISDLVRGRNLKAAEGLARLHFRTTISRQAADRFGLSHLS